MSQPLPDSTTLHPLPAQPASERVRERLRRGDRPGAVQSLRLFQHMNPSHAVPDDLVRLLAG